MKYENALSRARLGLRRMMAWSMRCAALSSAGLVSAMGNTALGQNIAYVDITAPPGGNGSSWASAYDSLHDALASPTTREIWVAQGVYRPDPSDRTVAFTMKTGVEVLGGFKGDETSRVQRDWVANETVLSGDLFENDGPNFFNTFDNSFHVVRADNVDKTAILDGFTVIAGNAEPGAAPVAYGGGVYAPQGQPVLRHCRFIDQQAAKGGSIYASGTGVIRIEDCFFGNSSVKSRGGAGSVHLDQSIHGSLTRCEFDGNSGDLGGALGVEFASALVTDCTFVNGTSGDRGGAIGGIESMIEVNGCTFTANKAIMGGAIGIQRSDLKISTSEFIENTARGGAALGGAIDLYQSNARISNCLFARNTAREGGAIATNFTDMVMSDCRVEDNVATGRGGGVSFQSGRIAMSGSRFIGNAGGTGGAMSFSQIAGWADVPNLLLCEFQANHSDGIGGALFVELSVLTMMQCRVIGNTSIRGGAGVDGAGDFVNSIFAGNRTNGDFGGAIKSSDRLHIAQCIIVGNESATSGGGVYYLGGAALKIVNSILWDNVSLGVGVQRSQLNVASRPSSLTVSYDCMQGGSAVGGGVGVISADPMFVDKRGPDLIYGTLDDDLHLLSYSPCRDAGANGLTPSDVYDLDGDGDRLEPLPFDFEGADRFTEDFWMIAAGSGVAPLVDMGAFEAMPSECQPDLDPNGVLDIFDFLAFQNLFVLQDPRADFDHSTGVGVFDIFDFLVYQTLFTRGCGP
jgi:hypothetical protein